MKEISDVAVFGWIFFCGVVEGLPAFAVVDSILLCVVCEVFAVALDSIVG